MSCHIQKAIFLSRPHCYGLNKMLLFPEGTAAEMLQVLAGWQWAAGSETTAGHKGSQSQAGVRDRDWKQKEDLPASVEDWGGSGTDHYTAAFWFLYSLCSLFCNVH